MALAVHASVDPSLALSRPRHTMDSAVTHTISSKAPALDSTSQQAKADIDPSLASGPARALDRLPHRLQTPHDLPDTETLSRQTSLGQTSATDSHFTSPTSPNAETGTPKPARGRLPSISELIANGHDSRAFSAASASPTMPSQHRPHPQFPHHRPTRSTGSTDHASPLMTSHPPATSMSPSAYAAYPAFSPSMTARSPTSAVIDGPYYSTANYYGAHGSLQHRRPSAVSDRGVLLPPTLNSASSSGDSGGATASSVDGYSTSHTTPIETAPRPTMMLPPPPAMMLGGFRCTYDGCTAPPFQTQYLLTSVSSAAAELKVLTL